MALGSRADTQYAGLGGASLTSTNCRGPCFCLCPLLWLPSQLWLRSETITGLLRKKPRTH